MNSASLVQETSSGSPPLFAAFETIRIINLAHRTDRRSQTNAELRRLRMADDPRVAFFKAVAPDDAGTFTSRGAHGVYLSHLALLEQAAERDEAILIFEDDIDFESAIWSYSLPQEWDIFYGAYYAKDPDDLPNSDIIGAHFMGFTAASARRLVPYLKAILASGHHPPIDGAYVWFRREHPDVRTVFAPMPLGGQRSSRTDIAELRWFDRWPGFRSGVALARRVKRRLSRALSNRTSDAR